MIEIFHGGRIFEDLGNLYACRDKLQHVSVIFQRTRLMLGSVTHFQRILQNGNQLLDLAVVKNAGGDPSLGGQPFQEINPFGPFPVGWDSNLPLVRFHWNGKLVLRNEVEGALRQTIIDLSQDVILLLDQQVGWQMRKVPSLRCHSLGRESVQQLMWAIKFVPVRWPPLRV